MKKTLLILLASAGLASAELSPKEFNEFRNFALTCGSGFYFAGTRQLGDVWLYRFCNGKDGQVAFVPMSVSTFEEARLAMGASLATFVTCEYRWKGPLDQLLGMTKTHLEEDSARGIVMAVPDGFVLETPEETAAEEAKKAQRIAK